jgi:ABC-type glycerol-3-phosphate transport system substrate-binding protein
VSSTNNGASIYLEAKKKPETYLTETQTPLWKDIFHTRLPKGPGGQFSLPFPFSDMVMGYSKNQKGAKDFLRWVHSKPVYDQWFASQQGFTLGPTAEWQNHPLWQDDPIMLPFRSLAEIGRVAGYAGPPNRAAAEVVTKYIITDMYAKAVQGMPAESAVKWAHGELVKIYT